MDLPPNVLQHVAIFLDDPAALAATCRATADLLSADSLLLDWAHAALARGTAFDSSDRIHGTVPQHRHPGYALLQWRRLYDMPTARLVDLLLRWLPRYYPDVGEAAGQFSAARQRLQDGCAVHALMELLPHWEHLLLPYVAQSGNKELLYELVGDIPLPSHVSLAWQTRGIAPWRAMLSSFTFIGSGWKAESSAECLALVPALIAAARGGHVDNMYTLLSALGCTEYYREPEEADVLHRAMLTAAVQGGARCAACIDALLQICDPYMLGTWAHDFKLPAIPDLGDEGLTRALLTAVADDSGHAYMLALSSGLIEMLPLVTPESWSLSWAAGMTCINTKRWISKATPQQLAHLAQSMLLADNVGALKPARSEGVDSAAPMDT